MLHKFIEIKKGEEQNYLDAGYFVVTNISNDWIYLTNNLHYVRAETVAAVAELDASLKKQESQGLVTIVGGQKAKSLPEEKPANNNLKKIKKVIKSEDTASASESPDEAANGESADADVAATAMSQETVVSDIDDENKGDKVQETA